MEDKMEEIKEILKLIEDNKIITEDGIKISGNGIIIKKLEKMTELQDKTNLKLFYVEDKLKKILELIERKV